MEKTSWGSDRKEDQLKIKLHQKLEPTQHKSTHVCVLGCSSVFISVCVCVCLHAWLSGCPRASTWHCISSMCKCDGEFSRTGAHPAFWRQCADKVGPYELVSNFHFNMPSKETQSQKDIIGHEAILS